MRRQTAQMAVITKCGMLLCLMLVGGLLATPAGAQVHVNVNIGAPPPPPVVVQAAPTMVYLTDPGLYVAVGVPYDIYFVSGRYYYFNDGNWFWGPGYGGPWTYVVYQGLPPGLQRYKVHRLHEFREREYAVYKVQGHGFKGKYFYAEDDQGEDHGGGKHGHGKGHKKH